MGTKEILKKDNEELKAAINMMGEEMATVANQQHTVVSLMNEIKELKKLNEEQQNKITFLETCVSHLEQYTRMNDAIITGLVI